MESLELLYDHYKDSIQLMKDSQRDRDRFFLIVCGLLALLFILGVSPEDSALVFKQLVGNRWGVNVDFDFYTVHTLVWILLLYYTVRYVQRNIYSERITKYIHKLEKGISEISKIELNRESSDYSDEYPRVLNVIYYIYTVLFPCIYIALISSKLGFESVNSPSLINLIIGVAAFVIMTMYMLYLHLKKLVRLFKCALAFLKSTM